MFWGSGTMFQVLFITVPWNNDSSALHHCSVVKQCFKCSSSLFRVNFSSFLSHYWYVSPPAQAVHHVGWSFFQFASSCTYPLSLPLSAKWCIKHLTVFHSCMHAHVCIHVRNCILFVYACYTYMNIRIYFCVCVCAGHMSAIIYEL